MSRGCMARASSSTILARRGPADAGRHSAHDARFIVTRKAAGQAAFLFLCDPRRDALRPDLLALAAPPPLYATARAPRSRSIGRASRERRLCGSDRILLDYATRECGISRLRDPVARRRALPIRFKRDTRTDRGMSRDDADLLRRTICPRGDTARRFGTPPAHRAHHRARDDAGDAAARPASQGAAFRRVDALRMAGRGARWRAAGIRRGA